MKKIFTTLLVAAALMIGITAKAQVKFGVKGGVNVTSMSFNNSVFDASNRTGFFIGPTVKIQLPLVGLGIDASALYDQREAKVKVADSYTTDKTLRCQAINVPINLRYGVSVSAMLVDTRQKNIAQAFILERYFFVSICPAAIPGTCLSVFLAAVLPLC